MRIGCLHTAASNVAVLERAATQLGGIPLRHDVRLELLAAAGSAGGVTPAIAEAVRLALGALAVDCDAMLLTCSSLGAVADGMASHTPVLRIDQALAEAAVAGGGRVIALCAAPTSLGPTGQLFQAAALRTGAQVDVRLVPDAWARFEAGDLAQYQRLVAGAVAAALAEDFAVVALAQVSMADAVEPSERVLTSPVIGLAAAVAASGA